VAGERRRRGICIAEGGAPSVPCREGWSDCAMARHDDADARRVERRGQRRSQHESAVAQECCARERAWFEAAARADVRLRKRRRAERQEGRDGMGSRRLRVQDVGGSGESRGSLNADDGMKSRRSLNGSAGMKSRELPSSNADDGMKSRGLRVQYMGGSGESRGSLNAGGHPKSRRSLNGSAGMKSRELPSSNGSGSMKSRRLPSADAGGRSRIVAGDAGTHDGQAGWRRVSGENITGERMRSGHARKVAQFNVGRFSPRQSNAGHSRRGEAVGPRFNSGAGGAATWRGSDSRVGRRKGARSGGAGLRQHRIEQMRRVGEGKGGLAEGEKSLFADAARFEKPARHAGFDLRRDPFLHQVAQLLAKVGDAIQTRQLESFERRERAFEQIVERRRSFTH